MKSKIVLFVSILICVSSCSTTKVQGQGKAPFITREFQSSSIKEVSAATAGGSIILTGDAGSKAVVEVNISNNKWSNEKIKQVLDENYTIDIKVENGKLYAIAKPKRSISNWNSQGLSISFKISVPKNVNSNLQTSGGSIHIGNLSGSQNFATSGGSLTVENVSGNTAGATSGGSITVTDSKDKIDLKTSGGSITAKNCSGNIDLSTSGGSINLNNLTGNIDAKTSGGSISAKNIKGTFKTGTSGGSVKLDDISGNLDARTSGGTMDVKIKSVNDYVKISNSGNINISLPAGKGFDLNVKANKIENGMKEMSSFRGVWKNESVDGTINAGGPKVDVKSSQRVRISFE